MKNIVCPRCGYTGQPKRITKGHLAVEIAMWLFFILPGVIYSVWRHASRYDGCPACGSDQIIPRNSPMGRKFLLENGMQETPEDIGRGESIGRQLGKAASKIMR